MTFSGDALLHVLDTWGYAAVFLFIMIESSGIPFPGETMLITAAIYAGTGHISVRWVIAAAAAGAIIGDNVGYWAGHAGGRRLILRYGRFVRLDEKKLDWAEGFYRRHGDKTVFLGRFVSVLRAWAAFLAGVNRMHWYRFLFFNAAGGIVWATVYGILGYKLAQNLPLLQSILRDWGIGSAVLVGAAVVVGVFIFWKRRKLRSTTGDV